MPTCAERTPAGKQATRSVSKSCRGKGTEVLKITSVHAPTLRGRNNSIIQNPKFGLPHLAGVNPKSKIVRLSVAVRVAFRRKVQNPKLADGVTACPKLLIEPIPFCVISNQ
ncbi:MAG: hypothetical protein V7K54_18280 [Nostoc sp.]